MTTCRYGFDLDGVVCDFWPVFEDKVKKMFNKTIYLNEVTSYNLEENLDLTQEQISAAIIEALFDVHAVRPINGAHSFITKYYRKTKEVPVFITCRGAKEGKYMEEIKRATADWLSLFLHPIPFEVTFTKTSKVQSVIDKGVNIYVEDRRRYALELADSEICVFLLDYPYNRHCENSRYLERVQDWTFIHKFFDLRSRPGIESNGGYLTNG